MSGPGVHYVELTKNQLKKLRTKAQSPLRLPRGEKEVLALDCLVSPLVLGAL